jgi:branched-chain amino acid transport system substrate-binding protein
VQAAVDLPVATTDGNMTLVQMEQYSAFLPKQLYVPAGEWAGRGNASLNLDPRVEAKQKEFVTAFQAAGIGIDVGSGLGWDPTWLVIDALRKFGTNASAEQIRQYVSQLKDYAGADGIYDFTRTPQRGLDAQNALITLWNPAAKTWEPVSEPGGTPLPRN